MARYVKNKDVQVQEYEWDFAAQGGATGSYDLTSRPNKEPLELGTIIKAVNIKVMTAASGAGSAAFGSGAASATYKTAAASGGYAADGLTVYSTPFVVTSENLGKVVMAIAGAPLTGGKIKVLVEFLAPASVGP